MNIAGRIFIACSLGAFIGTMVALQLGHWFWWVGMLVGGFVGYFSYEFKTVIGAVKASLEKVSVYTHWKGIGTIFLAYCCTAISIIPIFFGGWYVLGVKLGISGNPVNSYVTFVVILFCFFWIRLLKGEHRNEANFNGARNWIRMANPISLYLFYLPKGIWWCFKNSPKVIPFAVRFAKHLFILIHSDERLLCGTDAAIGTAMGYFSGHAVIGLIIGGILGVVNYEIVSKLWLKLPKHS